jgi:hypothetical protein
MSIVVVNQSTKITNDECTLIIQGFNKILPKFCTDWNLKLPTVILSKTFPTNTILKVYMMDNVDTSGIVEYHDNARIPIAKVFVNKILLDGGVLLYSATSTVPTVAQRFSHEIFEALVDPKCNGWWQSADKIMFLASEVVDPVKANVVKVAVNGTNINYSDWVLPTWSDPLAKKGPFNNLNTLKAPFTLATGGYAVQMAEGTLKYIYGGNIITTNVCTRANIRNPSS